MHINSNHILSIILILILACLLFYRNFLEPGQLIYVDMLFPNSLNRCLDSYTTTWNSYGSFPSISHIFRLPWMLIFLLPSQILNISMNHFLLTLFVLTFFTAGIGAYLLTYYSLKNSFSKSDKYWALSFASLLRAFFAYLRRKCNSSSTSA